MKQKNISPKCKRQLKEKSSSLVQLSKALERLLQNLKQELLEISFDGNLEISPVFLLQNLEKNQVVLLQNLAKNQVVLQL